MRFIIVAYDANGDVITSGQSGDSDEFDAATAGEHLDSAFELAEVVRVVVSRLEE